MENIMTSTNHPKRTLRLARLLGLGLGAVLLGNLGDRAFSASPANSGIDPLQILDTSIKNNVLFIVDTSGSMAGTPENQNDVAGGDDPASRFYQVKRAVRDVVSQNVGKANFGLATFDPDPNESQTNGNTGLIYVSQDPAADVWRDYFHVRSTTFSNIDTDTCTGGGGACTATQRLEIFRGLQTNGNLSDSRYPSGCTLQPAGNQVANSGVPNAPIPHVFGTHCRFYIKSQLLRTGKRYTVTPGISTTGTTREDTAVTTSTNITCPLPPPGLLGDDVLPFSDGTKPRACFQLKNASTGAISTYWITSAHFDYVDVAGSGGSSSCDSTGTVLDVADCGIDNSDAMKANMRLELQYNDIGVNAGLPRFVNTLSSVNNLKPSSTDVPPFKDVGIRQALFTPLAASMQFALNYYRTQVLNVAGTARRPVAAQGKQRQFVILLSDGDESCSGDPTAAAYALWSNTLPTLPSCTGSCLTSKGITAEEWATANHIELLMITFAGGTATTVNNISKAGTGRDPSNSVCQPLYPGFPGSPLAPCRNAFIANNLDELVDALNNAINTSTATGTYSDQQSVTETVYEYVSVANPPEDPLDPDNRYAVNVPILLQSTFELPDYKGHLNAFRRDDNGTPTDPTDDLTVNLWDAGQKMYDRLTDATNGMGPQPASPCTATGPGCYLFEELYGNATNSVPVDVLGTTAKIKRRIFTTTQNGVNTNYNPTNLLGASSLLTWTRVPLWPPTTGATSNTYVAPTATGTGAAPVKGILDTALGLDALLTVADVQAAVPGACQGTVPANIHPDCTSATAGLPLARAKREAREIILAYIAGARLQMVNGKPARTGTTGPAAGRQQLLYEARPWVMVESTLAAPGVVTPPLLAGPKSGSIGFEEYKHYRDGLKASNGAPINYVLNGLGLRNPDRADASANQTLKDNAANDYNLKPSMSVVYHATNQGLHALRAGPCPTPQAGSGLFGTPLPCQGETGGEELWAFVPFDQLGKLAAMTKIQTRDNKQYLLASPVRFSDVFVPGGASLGGVSFNGVWRTILYIGRGQGGKYVTALDITVPGPFTRHSLETEPPIVAWSRGNPDTTKGILTGAGGVVNNSAADYAAYLKMGETWSLPAVGFVTAADYTTTRTGSNGTNFVLFMGSGYSDVPTEGKTFYVLDALTGDVIRNFDIPNGSPAPPPIVVPPAVPDPPLTNFLVAPPVYYAEDTDGNSPSGWRFIGNPITVKAKTVYFGDLHSRIWRYDATTPAVAPTLFFQENTTSAGNQPFATAVSILQDRPDASIPGDVLIYAEAGHDRRVTPQPAKPFKAYAFKDTNGTRTDVFVRNFEANYRGTVQPATAFAGATLPPTPVVFFAGVKFTGSCVSAFDSILVALRGVSTTPGLPQPAFDLKATGDDAFIEVAGQKINAIRVSGEGNLVVDTGLNAENVPPPPGVPVPTETTSTSTSLVTIGLVPGTQAHRDLAPTTVPYRIGSSVCQPGA